MGEQPGKRPYLEPGEQRRFDATVLVVSVLLVAVVLGGYVLYSLDRSSDPYAAEEDERMGRGQQTSAPVTPPALPAATVTATPPTTTMPSVTPTTVTLPTPTQTVSGPVPCPGAGGKCLRGARTGRILHVSDIKSWFCTDEPNQVRCEHGSTTGGDGARWFGTLLVGVPAQDRSQVRSLALTVSQIRLGRYPEGRALAVQSLQEWLENVVAFALSDEPVTRHQIITWVAGHAGTAAQTRIAGYRITTTAVSEIVPGTWSASATVSAG